MNTVQSVIQFSVWQTPNDAPLSKALNIHGHTDPDVFLLFASDQGLASINGVRWSCRGREITGSHWPGLGMLGWDWSVGSPSSLIWHCMIPLMLLSIIDAELCSVHHLDTHPLTLWLAHCEDPGIPGTGLMQTQQLANSPIRVQYSSSTTNHKLAELQTIPATSQL